MGRYNRPNWTNLWVVTKNKHLPLWGSCFLSNIRRIKDSPPTSRFDKTGLSVPLTEESCVGNVGLKSLKKGWIQDLAMLLIILYPESDLNIFEDSLLYLFLPLEIIFLLIYQSPYLKIFVKPILLINYKGSLVRDYCVLVVKTPDK